MTSAGYSLPLSFIQRCSPRTQALASRILEDKICVLGLGLGLDGPVLGLGLGLVGAGLGLGLGLRILALTTSLYKFQVSIEFSRKSED